LAQDPSL